MKAGEDGGRLGTRAGGFRVKAIAVLTANDICTPAGINRLFCPAADLLIIGEGGFGRFFLKNDVAIIGVTHQHHAHLLTGDHIIGLELGGRDAIDNAVFIGPFNGGCIPLSALDIGKDGRNLIIGGIHTGDVCQHLHKLGAGDGGFKESWACS